MEEDQAPVSSEEIQKISSRILKEAPPGEFDECVHALKGFVDDKEAIDAAAADSYRIWAQNRVIPVAVGEDNHMALICEEANIEGNKYIDPTTSKSFNYDFANKKTVVVQPPAPQPAPAPLPELPAEGETPEGETPEGENPEGEKPEGETPEGENPEGETPNTNAEEQAPEAPAQPEEAALTEEEIPSTPLRDATQAAVTKFTEKCVANGVCGVYVKDEGVAIVISGSSISKNNFRCGSVIFHFKYEGGNLEGTISFFAHFFENGNTVTHLDSNFKGTVNGSGDEEIAEGIIGQLSKFYQQWCEKIQSGFDLLSDEGLNKLRRRMPITKCHINWNQELYGGAAMQVKK